MAEKYWYRLCLMAFLAEYIVWYTLIVCIPIYFWLFLTNWPKEYLIIYGTQAYISFILWIYYAVPHFYSAVFIFHQITYFLKLQFIHINNSLIMLWKVHKINPVINRSTELLQILHKHNQICVTLFQFNKFWSIELLLNSVLNSLTVLLLAYITFFSTVTLPLRMLFGSFGMMFTFPSFSCIFLSASSVATQVSIIQSNY
jgi:hypothetical protein